MRLSETVFVCNVYMALGLPMIHARAKSKNNNYRHGRMFEKLLFKHIWRNLKQEKEKQRHSKHRGNRRKGRNKTQVLQISGRRKMALKYRWACAGEIVSDLMGLNY